MTYTVDIYHHDRIIMSMWLVSSKRALELIRRYSKQGLDVVVS